MTHRSRSTSKLEIMFINDQHRTLYYVLTHPIRNYELYEMIYDFPEEYRYIGSNLSWLYSMKTRQKLYPNNDFINDTIFYYVQDGSHPTQFFNESEPDSDVDPDPDLEQCLIFDYFEPDDPRSNIISPSESVDGFHCIRSMDPDEQHK